MDGEQQGERPLIGVGGFYRSKLTNRSIKMINLQVYYYRITLYVIIKQHNL